MELNPSHGIDHLCHTVNSTRPLDLARDPPVEVNFFRDQTWTSLLKSEYVKNI